MTVAMRRLKLMLMKSTHINSKDDVDADDVALVMLDTQSIAEWYFQTFIHITKYIMFLGMFFI